MEGCLTHEIPNVEVVCNVAHTQKLTGDVKLVFIYIPINPYLP